VSVPTGRPFPEEAPEPPSGDIPKKVASGILRVAVEEMGEVRVANVAQILANALPQFNFNTLRTTLWRLAMFRIGEGSLVMGDLLLTGTGDWSQLLTIGAHTFITGPLRMNLGGHVHIGNAVNIGHDCLFLTVDHEIGPPWRRAGLQTHRTIVVEDGAWIASRVTLLPGVTIGRGAVVAAGAVVAKDVPAHTLVGGVPARVIRVLDEHESLSVASRSRSRIA
jgi:acetyltransferase-like isoleucine patch superfamily enzyme